MSAINRRTALARMAAVPAAMAVGTGIADATDNLAVAANVGAKFSLTSPDAALVAANEGASEIQTLFREWLYVARRYAWPETQEEADRGYAEYRRLQDAIIFAEPVCARDVAIMLYVDTDEGESLVSDDFRRRMYAVAGMPVPSWEAES